MEGAGEDSASCGAGQGDGRRQLATLCSIMSAVQSGAVEAEELAVTVRTELDKAGLVQLPSELIDAILGLLPAVDLAMVARVCRKMHHHAYLDIHWQRHILSNLPGNAVSSPYPCMTWRELYVGLDPYWFLPKHKIWFGDAGLTGRMVLVRFDSRRGTIEGYQLVATRGPESTAVWGAEEDIVIPSFRPEVKLHLDRPAVELRLRQAVDASDTSALLPQRAHKWLGFAERSMPIGPMQDTRYSNIILTKAMDGESVQRCLEQPFPYGHIWPPPTIPTKVRVGASGVPSVRYGNSKVAGANEWRASRRSEATDQMFKVRQWMQLSPRLDIAVGEEMATYSTLEPALYTPTAEKPWRGIWVGDYNSHGCEFLLIHQPDDADGEEQERGVLRRMPSETDADFEERFLQERVYKGRLEATKLTGDPNVPRGEHTFIVEDMGSRGFLRVEQRAPFEGARVVKSRGHIASAGFYNDRYMDSELLLLSHDRIAQHWIDFAHVSFFERVNIDKLLERR